jgi:hypothetical protein
MEDTTTTYRIFPGLKKKPIVYPSAFLFMYSSSKFKYSQGTEAAE